jgi:hypothetical protein
VSSLFPATSTHTDIEILPANVNRTIFQDGSFRRTCRYTGSTAVGELRILHNGDVIDSETEGDSIMLDVGSAQLSNVGPYTCQVVFTDSTSISASMGTLTVVELTLITAPPNQYVVEGEDISLECSFDNTNLVYGTVIITIRRGGQTTSVINSAAVDDEGEYACDISLISHDSSTQVPIILHVFTPININDYPENYQTLYGVQEAMFTVSFTGRESQGLDVSWFKNGVQLSDSDDYSITTAFSEELRRGNTSIHFPQMRRSDGGVYRVLVSTDFGEKVIGQDSRRDDQSFQVDVIVPPPDPAEFKAAVVREHQVEFQWDLPITHPDQDASSFLLQVIFPNGSTAVSASLDGSARSTVVNVFPGVLYNATLIARNGDGLGQSATSFETPPAAPYVSLFEARRLNETHFNISISLLYTGGGDTTTFSVYFREQDSIEWSSDPIMVLILDSLQALEYHGVISGEEKLRGKGPLEFELRVKNGRGFMNRTGSGPEKSDPPGPPSTITVDQISDTSVRLDFKLPEEGTPPFINIILEFSKPQVMERNFSGTYYPGQNVMKEVRDLNPKTAYRLKARAVNYAGNGTSSETIDFETTDDTPSTATPTPDESTMESLMMPIIYGGAAGGGIIILIIPLMVFCCCCHCHLKKRQQKVRKPAKGGQEADPESGDDSEKETKGRKSPIPPSEGPPSSTPSSISTLEKKPCHVTSGNIYLPVPQRDHREGPSPTNTGSSGSQSPAMKKWKGHNQASCSTLNSAGGSATQDSYMKKPDILSTTESEIQLSSLQSSQASHQVTRDSLGYYRRQKGINPSISSGGSETTTETTERYQTTPFLQSSLYSSSQTIPFTPQGLSYASLSYSDQTPTQTHYSPDQQPQSQCTDV